MSEFSRETLLNIIETDHVQCGEASALARMALAAMDSEPDRNPVLAYADSYRDMAKQGVESVTIWSVITDLERNIAPLYRHAQPAPEYPEVLPCSVLLEPGLRFGKGIKTSTMLAALARRAVHESDMAALSLEERVEFQARIEDFKALIAQPAPVVPDELNTRTANDVMNEHLSWKDYGDAEVFCIAWNACRAAMLAAAKQSPGSEPVTVPGKWIPVSERMPENDGAYLCWDNRYVTTYAFIFGAWQANQFVAKNITHWMPLPNPPKE